MKAGEASGVRAAGAATASNNRAELLLSLISARNGSRETRRSVNTWKKTLQTAGPAVPTSPSFLEMGRVNGVGRHGLQTRRDPYICTSRKIWSGNSKETLSSVAFTHVGGRRGEQLAGPGGFVGPRGLDPPRYEAACFFLTRCLLKKRLAALSFLKRWDRVLGRSRVPLQRRELPTSNLEINLCR